MAYFKALTQNLTEGTEEENGDHQPACNRSHTKQECQ